MTPCRREAVLRPTNRCLYHLALVAGIALLCLQPATSAEPSATTDYTPLLQRVRDNVARDDEAMLRYSYTLHRRTYSARFGKVSNGDEHTYEVQPSPFEPGTEWRRLVAINGVRLTPEEQRRSDDKARREALSRQRDRERETPAARARRVTDEQEAKAKQRARLDDVGRVFRFGYVNTEVVEGRPRLVFEVTPRPEVTTVSDQGKNMKKVRGRMWVDERDAQLVRIEMQAFEDITIGFGVIGRVSRNSVVSYARTRIGDGTWLPAEARFKGTGSTLLLLPFSIETWSKYSGYQAVAPANRTPEAPTRH